MMRLLIWVLVAVAISYATSRGGEKKKEKGMEERVSEKKEKEWWDVAVRYGSQDKQLNSLVAEGQLESYEILEYGGGEGGYIVMIFPNGKRLVMTGPFGCEVSERPLPEIVSREEYERRNPYKAK